MFTNNLAVCVMHVETDLGLQLKLIWDSAAAFFAYMRFNVFLTFLKMKVCVFHINFCAYVVIFGHLMNV